MTSFTSQLLRLNTDQAIPPKYRAVAKPRASIRPIRLVIELKVVGGKLSVRKP